MAKAQKSRASKVPYVSPNQLELVGFESPFTKYLDPCNRWVKLAKQIPWDKITHIYKKQLTNSITGAGGINPRVAIGAIFIKHMCDLSDRETVQIEGKFGQAKRAYGMNRIKARLQHTSESWIASIIGA